MASKYMLIQELRRENLSLRKELNEALQFIPHVCFTCKHESTCSVECTEIPTTTKRYWSCGHPSSLWEWKGRCIPDEYS